MSLFTNRISTQRAWSQAAEDEGVRPPLNAQALEGYAREAGLEFVVLFGSQASARATARSDLDLALMPSRGDLDPEPVELGLIRALGRSDLDLVWLPHADWLLGWKVAESGRALYERQPGRFHRYRVRAALRRWDGRIWHQRNHDFLRRMLERSLLMDAELVTSKLARLGQYLLELEEFVSVSEKDFLDDVKTHRAAERQAELLVECAAAINTEVSQSVAGIPPSDYYSSFFSLASAGWLDREVARRLADMAGLRNRLVHEYEELQLPRLYRALVRSLPDWRAYLECVRARLEQPGDPPCPGEDPAEGQG